MAYMSGSVFSMWQAYRYKNILPRSGGWENQPLFVLAQIEAIDLIYSTWRYIRSDNSDWGKLSATQTEIVKQVELWLV